MTVIIVASLGFFIGKKYLFLKVSISDEYYIQQKPFTKNYVLKSRNFGTIVENLYEWKEENKHIFGSGYGYYYIYDKVTNGLLKYDENTQSEEFYQKIKELGYHYRIDSCTRVLDFTMTK